MQTDTRRYDVDWLRVFATYLLFFFHVAKAFDVSPFYHIKNTELSLGLDALTMSIHFWHMPLFFALAGWAAHASLSRRGSEGFMQERVRRLLVPFALGVIFLCPPIKYFELKSGFSLGISGYVEFEEPFRETFLEFLPTFFTNLDRFTWSHLWFLIYLFTFTMLYRGFFVRLLAQPERFAQASSSRLYLPLVPLVLIQITLRLVWPGGQNLINDWANFAFYSTFFILGFLWARNPVWDGVIDREWKRAGAISAVSYGLMLWFWIARAGKVWPEEPSLTAVLQLLPVLALTAVAGYCTIVAMIGFARKHLCFGGVALGYLAESALPIYVLHQSAIVLPGYFLLQLPLPPAVKFPLVLVTAVVLAMAVYHFLIRPAPAVRPAFGMKASTA